MTFPAFTALTFMVAFASARPDLMRDDPERLATIAIAAERAQSALIATWHRSPRLLGAAIVEGIVAESRLDERVHDGTRRGLAGEVCLMQISNVNSHWRPYAESREALAGIDLSETTACILSGVDTLIAADRRCSRLYPRRSWLSMMWTSYQSGSRCGPSKEGRLRELETNRYAWTKWQATDAHVVALAEAREFAARLRGSI